MRPLFHQRGCLAGREDGETDIAAHEQFAQRFGANQPAPPFFIAETEIGLWFNVAEGGVTLLTGASSRIVQFVARFRWAEAAKGSVSIEVERVTGDGRILIIKGACAANRVEIAHQLIEGG